MDVELILPRHAVNLRNGLVLLQRFRHLCQRVRQCFNLKIAGNRAADLLRIDDGGIFLNDPPLLQCLDTGFYRHPGYPYFLPDVGIRYPSIFNQQPDDLLVQRVQSFQKHGKAPLSCVIFQ